jgi:hypothetical protein
MPRPPAFRFRRWLCRACLGLLVGVCGDPADAGQSSPVADALVLDESGGPNEPQREVKSGKVARAIRLMAAPVIDGRLDDEAWHAVPALTGFAQRDPDNGDAMSEATFVRIAYDDRFLYLAILCQDRDAAAIAGGLGRRDEVPQTDQISIGLDPRHDHLTGFFFQTNPSGWQGDLFMYDDDRMDRDFNAVWEVRTQVVAGGWSAEFRIPFSQLRFTASLRGNTVLRWEYVRGSTFFAVWELSRADATRPGAFRPLRDLGTAFGSGADHVLMAKVSYWMNQ